MRKLHVIHLDTSSSKIGFAFDKPNDKIAIFNCLVTECLDRHALLKRIKMTQPPVPWLNDQSIGSLQVNLANQPQEAHGMDRTFIISYKLLQHHCKLFLFVLSHFTHLRLCTTFTSYCMGMSLLSILYLISKYEQKKQEKKIQVCNVAIFLF